MYGNVGWCEYIKNKFMYIYIMLNTTVIEYVHLVFLS